MKKVVVEGSEIGTSYVICDHPGCANQFKQHYWGSINAAKQGWFLKLNGESWCPEHIPKWVAEWRAKQKG